MTREIPEEVLIRSTLYRRNEQAQYKLAETHLPAMKENRLLVAAAQEKLNEISLELHERRVADAKERRKSGSRPILNFEAHHESEVARQAFLIKVVESSDLDAAAEHTRRRMGLTCTLEEFLASDFPEDLSTSEPLSQP